MSNELGRLSQGVVEQMPTELDTVHFISKDEVPKVKFANYARCVQDTPSRNVNPFHTADSGR